MEVLFFPFVKVMVQKNKRNLGERLAEGKSLFSSSFISDCDSLSGALGLS